MTTFKTKIKSFGNNTGIEVPEKNIQELGESKKPPVTVHVNNYIYKSTVGIMGGKFMISLPKAHREAAGLKGGDEVKIILELDDGFREVVIPSELKSALKKSKLEAKFNKLAYSKRKEFARQIAEAKGEDTKKRRLDKIIESIK